MSTVRSANDELESVELVGRKGGEAEGTVVDPVQTPSASENPTGGDENSGGAPESKPYKVLDREYASPEEMAAEIERQQKRINEQNENVSILKDPEKLRQYQEKTYGNTQPKSQDPDDEELETRKRFLKETYGLVDASEVDKRINTALSTQEVIRSVKSFAGEHNGSDGLPKADFDQMVKYMDERGIYDPQDAYWLMNRDAIREHYAKKAVEGDNTKPLSDQKKDTSAGKVVPQQQTVRYNDDEARRARRAEIIARRQQ